MAIFMTEPCQLTEKRLRKTMKKKSLIQSVEDQILNNRHSAWAICTTTRRWFREIISSCSL